MGRSNSRRRNQKAARRDFSNRRLPTFEPSSLTSYIDHMVGLDPIPYDVVDPYDHFPQPVVNSFLPEKVQSTAFVPLKNSLIIPNDVSLSPSPKQGTKETVVGVSLDPLQECVHRAQREEVLHALKKTGKSGQKSPKWTEKSKIKCP